jgi:hypothetical protein
MPPSIPDPGLAGTAFPNGAAAARRPHPSERPLAPPAAGRGAEWFSPETTSVDETTLGRWLLFIVVVAASAPTSFPGVPVVPVFHVVSVEGVVSVGK